MTVEELRSRIETVDYQILELIRKRTELGEEIGKLKAAEGMPVRVPEAEAKVVERYRSFAESEGLDPDAAERICRILIEESVRVQERK